MAVVPHGLEPVGAVEVEVGGCWRFTLLLPAGQPQREDEGWEEVGSESQ